jgi:DNA-binding NarL/FixJ family response regulator
LGAQAATGGAMQAGTVPARPITVLLVDAHELLARALAVFLGADPELEVVGTLTDPERAVSAVRETRPDVAILSYFLMRHDGGHLPALLRAEHPELKMLILTSSLDRDTLAACIEAGAVGCVVKYQAPAELVDAIKRVRAGEVLFPSQALLKLLRLPRQAPAQPSDRLFQPLAPRELEVLQTLASGLTTEEVAAHLYISPHTVRTHVKNLMIKLQARSKVEAILTGLKEGLIELPR